MSEIHFDQEGEPAEPHATCTEIRWRYFPNPGTRGAPRIVHDKRNGGAPLYTPVDISYVELRDLVDGVAGYYRGDQVDQNRRPIPGVKPFYVSIAAAPRNAAGGGTADELVRHLVESNTRQSETLINQLAAVMREQRKTLKETRKVMRTVATADLRELFKQFSASLHERDEEEEDDEEEDGEDGANGVMQDIKDIAREVSSAFETWMLDRAAQRAEAAKTRTTAPVVPTSSTPSANLSPAAPPPPPAAPPPAPPPADVPAAAPTSSAPPTSSATVPTTAPTAGPATEVRNAASAMPTPEQAAHLMAILHALEPPERAIARAVVKRMGDEQRARWLAELSTLTVEQSVELVRAAIAERTKKESQP